jgi:hypothetical protein
LAELKYLGMTVRYQTFIHEEIESRFNSGMFNTIQFRTLSSHLLSKNITIKIQKTITLSVVLYGCETLGLGGTQTEGV